MERVSFSRFLYCPGNLALLHAALHPLAVTSILMYVVLTVSWQCSAAQPVHVLATAHFWRRDVHVCGPGERLPFRWLSSAESGEFSHWLLTGYICLRLRGFYFAIFTFGLNELVRNFVLWWRPGGTHRRQMVVLVTL